MPGEAREVSNPTDAELAVRAQAGDRDAFAVLVDRYEPRVCAVARAIARDSTSAEDAAQDAFMAAWRHLDGYDPSQAFGPWLMTIARNAARRTFRRKVGEPRDMVPLDQLGLAAGWGASPEALSERHQLVSSVREAVGALADEDAEIIWLRDIEGLTGREASDALGLAVPAMKSRLHRARLRLMAKLQGGGHV